MGSATWLQCLCLFVYNNVLDARCLSLPDDQSESEGDQRCSDHRPQVHSLAEHGLNDRNDGDGQQVGE